MHIACVQSNVVFDDPATNGASAIVRIRKLAREGIDLIVFPECFLTGYCVDNKEEAKRISIPLSHSVIQQITSACARSYPFIASWDTRGSMAKRYTMALA